MTIRTEITSSPLPPIVDTARPHDGAELIFHGRVRDREDSQPIAGLHYEHYEGMAQRELERLAHATAERFAISELICLHRVGDVPIGEASLRVVVLAPHRAASLEAMAWFITELKRTVPIWKWLIRPDGSRHPT